MENNTPPGFFARLKQHHMYQVTIAYALITGFLIQLASRALPAFGWGGAFPAVIIILLAVFPVVLVLAWMLIKPKDPAKYTSWQKLHWKLGAVASVVIVAAAVVSGFYAWHIFEHHAERLATEQAVAADFNPPSDSIVVLPFANLSGDPKQAYFSNGITEELTDALGQTTGLTVIAWETASKYVNGKQTPEQIGKALNVAHVLGGSIEHDGNAVRVSVELVSTVTGQQLWSEHYDDSLKNIFTVQDKISAAIAEAIKVKFAGLQAAPTQNPEAHELYLKGVAAADRSTAADVQAALGYFQQALKLDPNYADAWALLGGTYLELSAVSTLPLQEALPKLRAAAKKALALDPHNIPALVALGNADASDNRVAEARAEYQQALALDPSNAAAHLNYGTVLPLEPASAQYQEATRLDPDDATAQNDLAVLYQDLANWPQMAAAAQALNRLSPYGIDAAFYLAFAYTQMQRGEDAVKAFDLVQPSTPLDRQLVDAGRLTYQALLKPSLRPKALAALEQLRRANISPLSQADLLQLYLALGEKETTLRMLPGNCANQPVGCNDLAINPMYVPLHGDPRFEKLSQKYTTITLQ